MDAIELLKDDHRLVDSLFERIEATTPSKYPPIIAKIKGALDTHAHIEEKLFYPRLKKDGKKDLVDIVLEGLEEHKQMKTVLRDVASLTPKNQQYEAKAKVLIENTRHHVKEEENEMFPLVRDQFSSEELQKLGDRMQAEKEKYQKANGIEIPRPQKGVVTRLVEVAGELVSGILTTNGDGKKTPKPSGRKAKSGTTSAKKATSSSGRSSSKSKNGNGGKSAAKGKTGNGGKSASKNKPKASSTKTRPARASSRIS